jgi:hypothetical protein
MSTEMEKPHGDKDPERKTLKKPRSPANFESEARSNKIIRAICTVIGCAAIAAYGYHESIKSEIEERKEKASHVAKSDNLKSGREAGSYSEPSPEVSEAFPLSELPKFGKLGGKYEFGKPDWISMSDKEFKKYVPLFRKMAGKFIGEQTRLRANDPNRFSKKAQYYFLHGLLNEFVHVDPRIKKDLDRQFIKENGFEWNGNINALLLPAGYYLLILRTPDGGDLFELYPVEKTTQIAVYDNDFSLNVPVISLGEPVYSNSDNDNYSQIYGSVDEALNFALIFSGRLRKFNPDWIQKLNDKDKNSARHELMMDDIRHEATHCYIHTKFQDLFSAAREHTAYRVKDLRIWESGDLVKGQYHRSMFDELCAWGVLLATTKLNYRGAADYRIHDMTSSIPVYALVRQLLPKVLVDNAPQNGLKTRLTRELIDGHTLSRDKLIYLVNEPEFTLQDLNNAGFAMYQTGYNFFMRAQNSDFEQVYLSKEVLEKMLTVL